MLLYLFYFFFFLIGDYGIIRSMGVTMTMGVGTGFEVKYFCLFHFFNKILMRLTNELNMKMMN
jgi:hypothetical protein